MAEPEGERRRDHGGLRRNKVAFKEHAPVGKIIRAPAACLNHMLSVYPIVDIHLGHPVRRQGDRPGERSRQADGSPVDRTPRSKHALIISPSDFFHAGDQRNVIPKSGLQLDVDSRFPKVLIAGVKTLIRIIERPCRSTSSWSIRASRVTTIRPMYFDNNKRVKIDVEWRDFDWVLAPVRQVLDGATHMACCDGRGGAGQKMAAGEGRASACRSRASGVHDALHVIPARWMMSSGVRP